MTTTPLLAEQNDTDRPASLPRQAAAPRKAKPGAAGGTRHWMGALFLFFATAAIFLPTLYNGFVGYDDPENVFAEPMVTQGLRFKGVRWAFTHPILGHWDPLTTLSHMLDCSLFELNPWGHHLTSVLLHSGAALLFFLALARMTGRFWPAFFAAALFAWHPLRVESVAWISERKDVLSAFFFMGALLAYVSYARRPSFWRYLWVAMLFAGGLMSKSMLVTFPCVLLLLDWWPLGRSAGPIPSWKLIAEKIPLFLLSAASAVAQMMATQGMQVTLSWPDRLSSSAVDYLLYLGKFFWPSSLCVLYLRPTAWPAWEIAFAAALLLGVTLAAWLCRRAASFFLTGWLWFLGMLVPVCGIIQIGDQSIADRYSYLPSAGLAVALAWGAAALTHGWRRQRVILTSAAAISLLACVLLTTRQIPIWRDGDSLFRNELAIMPEKNIVAQLGLGVTLMGSGNVDEAIEHFESALDIGTDPLRSNLNLAAAFYLQKKLPESILHYMVAEKLAPALFEPHMRLAELMADQGNLSFATAEAKAAVAADPKHAGAHIIYGALLRRQGKTEEAVGEYRALLQIYPDNFDAHNNLGIVFMQQSRVTEAVAELREAVRLQPNRPESRMNLAVGLTSQGALEEAIEQYRAILSIRPDLSVVQERLAALLAKKKEAAH